MNKNPQNSRTRCFQKYGLSVFKAFIPFTSIFRRLCKINDLKFQKRG